MKPMHLLVCALLVASCQSNPKPNNSAENSSTAAGAQYAKGLLTQYQQFTFAGRRSGEGYFSQDGKFIIFQSEREADNPFYQMYLQDLESGKVVRVSPGYGKTTCGWIHPNGKKVMYSSTHQDPQARQKQETELDFRASGQKRRYSWDYDENYDIYSASLDGKNLKNLTRVKGYDAEGSYSPDGQWIAFASNRHAYTEALSSEDRQRFEQDPSYMLEIYLMKADGSNVRRLTYHKGYDGGPFFSPDGQKIVWRRFTPDGHTAEVYTMNLDGSGVRQITELKSMSWAPFYHPSGDYFIFTTNLHGFNNFELYLVDAEGRRDPVRVTDLEGFDGLPVFHPNGHQVYWARSVTNGESQIFKGEWNDALARQLLNLPPAAPRLAQLKSDLDAQDAKSWVYYLASEKMKGRDTGAPEEKIYGQAVAKFFSDLGLKPAGDSKTYFQSFEFEKSLRLGTNNHLQAKVNGKSISAPLNKDWRPLASGQNPKTSAGVVFAGYGIVAPESGKNSAYDSFKGVDVKDKWVLAFRYLPEDVSAAQRAHLNNYSRIAFKAMSARNRGATGLLLVSGPRAKVKEQLIHLEKSGLSGQISLPVISVSDELAQQILNSSGKTLKELQAQLDKGQELAVFDIPQVQLSAQVDIIAEKGHARNILALLPVSGARHTLVIGAHGDHLGTGHRETSLMSSADKSETHFGADDNASGMAGVLELAHYFSDPENRKGLKQNLLFAIWSGEERGILGSHHFIQSRTPKGGSLYPDHSAYINMDMIGRLREHLSIQGVGSSSDWAQVLEKIGPKMNIPIITHPDPYLPTDSMAFYVGGVPVINFFTGAHSEYHTPRDTAEKINYEGLRNVLSGIAQVTQVIAGQSQPLPYTRVVRNPHQQGMGRGFRLFLGTIPDYTQSKIRGVLLSGVIKGGPAEKAGLQKGDVIVEFGKMKIENIHDYVFSLQANKPGEKTNIVVLRDGQRKEMEIVPTSKE